MNMGFIYHLFTDHIHSVSKTHPCVFKMSSEPSCSPALKLCPNHCHLSGLFLKLLISLLPCYCSLHKWTCMFIYIYVCVLFREHWHKLLFSMNLLRCRHTHIHMCTHTRTHTQTHTHTSLTKGFSFMLNLGGSSPGLVCQTPCFCGPTLPRASPWLHDLVLFTIMSTFCPEGGKMWRGWHTPFLNCLAHKLGLPLPFICHWPEFKKIAICSCQGGREMLTCFDMSWV